jgi:hypothetical protein
MLVLKLRCNKRSVYLKRPTLPSSKRSPHFETRTYLPTYLSMALQPFAEPWPLFQFFDLFFFIQPVGLLGRVIIPSQGRYLHTGQHKHRINAYRHSCLKLDSNPRSAFGRAKTVHALDCAATVTGMYEYVRKKIFVTDLVESEARNDCADKAGSNLTDRPN